ncbi:hypothetical protein E2C01_023148 [Portunus trituberculatus]|uniref:Uncharacterized protein n=1 Tax=Portunus trituberculatus TaxID=210409 RepID=A0A5B7E9M0_PORTR|nr:hypothetical protein [Portunus trituberculatus]
MTRSDRSAAGVASGGVSGSGGGGRGGEQRHASVPAFHHQERKQAGRGAPSDTSATCIFLN